MYRACVIALCLMFAALQYRLWIADGGYADVNRLQDDIQALQTHNDELRSRNAAMDAEIVDLKSGELALEGRARADLGMIRQGERFFLVVD
ncbi:MAG: cell division protein FtsB [Salinisphaeraceae bacterium]|jgi:cell division protein FtsB|nr:cell division protein FtsB [Salinisphaeraceae bacterium]